MQEYTSTYLNITKYAVRYAIQICKIPTANFVLEIQIIYYYLLKINYNRIK